MVAGAVCIGIPVVGLLLSDAPVAGRAVVAGVLAVALVHPETALLVLAGLVPLGSVIGSLTGMPYSLCEPLVLAFIAGWLARHAARDVEPRANGWRRVFVPALFLGAAVAASSAVWLAAGQPFLASSQFLRETASFLWSDFFADRSRFSPLTDGLVYLEGLGLFAAVIVLCEGRPSLPRAVARMAAAGALGVAALSLNRVATVALRSGDTWRTAWHQVAAIRVSAAFPDYNAAGSYFALFLFLALALAVGAGGVRWRWIFGAMLLVAALWLTGSRAALFAVPICAVATLVMTDGRRPLKPIRLALVIGAVVVAAAAGAVSLSGRDTMRWTMQQALGSRLELGRAGLAMAKDHPVVGVGVGRFKAVSGGYLNPDFRRLTAGENAHNNFLQILAELGLVGFVPFIWLLVVVGSQVRSAVSSGTADALTIGTAGGIAAFLVTCFFGHPLLINEVAHVFWLVLATCFVLANTSLRNTPQGRSATRRRGWLVPLALAVVAATVPVRSQWASAVADLSEATTGLSSTQTDGAGTSFRWLTDASAQFFVPADARLVRVPFRLVSGRPSTGADLAIFLDGRPANRVHLEAGIWTTVAFAMPSRQGARFRRFEIRLDNRELAARSARGKEEYAREGIQMGWPAAHVDAGRRTAAADFNGDGQPDLLWRNATTGENMMWLMDGAEFLSQVTLDTVADVNWYVAGVADINGDGWPDIVWRHAVSGLNPVWFTAGATLVSQALLPSEPDPNWRAVAVADFNADDHPDIVWRHATTGQNVIWHLSGTAFLGQTQLPPAPDPNWLVVAAADFNGDGRPDLAWRNQVTGQNVVWFLEGTTFLSQADLPPVPDAGWRVATARDFNKDGKPDLVWRNQSTGENLVWCLDGTILLGQVRLPPKTPLGWTLAADRR